MIVSFLLQMVSEKNKANRDKKKMVQVTGKKSYAIKREEVKVIIFNYTSANLKSYMY